MKNQRLPWVKGLCVLAVLVSIAEGLFIKSLLNRGIQTTPFELLVDKEAPYAEQIKEIIKPLRYSGLPALLNPEVSLGIDAQNQTWTLTHYHHYDDKQRIQLNQNRYGICQTLTAYTYAKLLPLIDLDRYTLSAFTVAESSFFPTPTGNHIVLLLKDKQDDSIFGKYIIDPSFRRYQNIQEFRTYGFQSEVEAPALVALPTPDMVNDAGRSSPLEVRKNRLIAMGVKSIENQFDHQHFEIGLTVKERHDYVGSSLIRVKKEGTELKITENRKLITQVLTPTEHVLLRKRLVKLANGAKKHRTIEVPAPVK